MRWTHCLLTLTCLLCTEEEEEVAEEEEEVEVEGSTASASVYMHAVYSCCFIVDTTGENSDFQNLNFS